VIPASIARDGSVPDVSVLIVNFNVKDYLLQCLQSLASSDGDVSMEVIVVDNASIDGSVDDLRPKYPWVKWIESETNLGFGRANNLGITACRGKFILFLNPDTIVGQGSVATMVQYLRDHPSVGLAGCKVLNADGTFQLACRRGFPTPWASFCKLFGLQSLFPTVPFFSQYNQTYKSVDATYPVDALIGAFMIGPRGVIERLGGFDESFFMYGEDLDLCFRVQSTGLDIMYVHTTSIVHFKGESTRRSSMNEVREFYHAMEIFVRKHYGGSSVFLAFLRFGIAFRSVLERLLKRKREIGTMFVDLVGVNLVLMLATSIRFSSPFGFPPEAYPLVFFVVTGVVLCSLLAVGEYVEFRPGVRRTATGLFISFFLLASLTYFFKEYAYSRGVLLMTIGLSIVWTLGVRFVWAAYDAWIGRNAIRNIALVGLVDSAKRIVDALAASESRNTRIVGFLSAGSFSTTSFHNHIVLGSTDYLEKIVRDYDISEVIIADDSLAHQQAMDLMIRCSSTKVRFHLAAGYDDLVIARVINDVSGVEPTIPISPLLHFRNRVAKRAFDIIASIVVLVILLPVIFLGKRVRTELWLRWLDVLRGSRSVVGLYPDARQRLIGKSGLTGLAHISIPATLAPQAVQRLNDFYIEHFTLSLDVEILLHHFRMLLRGNKHHS